MMKHLLKLLNYIVAILELINCKNSNKYQDQLH